MKFSTRTRYGLRFLVYLASCPQGQLVQLKDLAINENISAGYLEQIVRSLKPLGILESVRGAAGGYKLAHHPKDITLEDIFTHLEGDISPVACILETNEPCSRIEYCSTRRFWEDLNTHVRSFLRTMTLDDYIVKYGIGEKCHHKIQSLYLG